MGFPESRRGLPSGPSLGREQTRGSPPGPPGIGDSRFPWRSPITFPPASRTGPPLFPGLETRESMIRSALEGGLFGVFRFEKKPVATPVWRKGRSGLGETPEEHRFSALWELSFEGRAYWRNWGLRRERDRCLARTGEGHCGLKVNLFRRLIRLENGDVNVLILSQ